MSTRSLNLYVRAAAGAVLSCLVTAGALVAVTKAVRPPAQDRHAAPGTTWLSGESRGRAVLAAPGSQAGSIAVALGDPGTFDVTSLAKLTAVLDRQSGALTLLDPALGTVKERKPRVVPRGAGVLVAAGSSAYVVDATASTVRRVTPEGRVGDAVTVAAFTSFTGTRDGRLWLFDQAAGTYGSGDGGGDPARTRIVEQGTPAVLSAVGDDAVLLEGDQRRLHWLGRGVTLAVEPTGTPLLLQEPDLSGFSSCVTVLVGARAVCYGPDGNESVASLPGAAPQDAQVFSGQGGVVVAGASSDQVLAGPWGSELTPRSRTSPSSRRLTGSSTPTAILVDDPGSQYAFTSTGTAFTSLDKFSKRTVLITPDGPKIDLDADTQTVSKIPTPIPNANDPSKNEPDTNGVNDRPLPVADRVRTRSGRPVNVDVLANDVDPDGDTLVIVGVGAVSRGTATVLLGSSVLYTPPADFVGTVTFEYRVADPGGLDATADVTVDIVGADQNESPALADDTAETIAGVAINVPVLANDSDPEGDPLTIVAVSTPSRGSVAVTADGQLRYEPTATDGGGVDEFQYTVVDGFGGRASARVRVTIDSNGGKNRPPVAVDDRSTVVAGKRVRVAALANDTDPDGDALRIVATGNVFGVTASIVGGQSVDIVPDLRTTGVVSVQYTVEDASGLRATAAIVLVVEAPTPNRAPQAIDDNVVVASKVQVVDVVANDVDPDGDQLTVVGVTQPAVGGTVTKNSATTVRFVPTVGFTSPTSFEYTVSDPDGLTATATVNVQVVPPTGSGPVAVDDNTTIYVGDTARIAVLANDSHPDGIPFTLAGPPTVRAGQAVVNIDNTISYTPPAGQAGTFVLPYTIRDFYNRTASAKIVVTVLAIPVGGGGVLPPELNHAPSAVDDRAFTTYQTPITIDVLSNDSDPDGQSLVVGTVTAGTGGTPTIVQMPPGAGSAVQVRFQPDPGFSGLASFGYSALDPSGGSTPARVVVEVGQKLKVSPLGRDDLLSMAPASTVTFDPRTNDIDPDGPSSALRINGVTTAPGLTISIDGGGTLLRVTSTGGGTYDFGYQIVDPDGLVGVAAVRVTVGGAVNHPPVAVNDVVTVGTGAPTVIDVLANDSDPDGSAIHVSAVTQPAAGGTVSTDGASVTFTPAASFVGTASFAYTVVDTAGLPAQATVTVTVEACSALAPLVADDSATTAANTARLVDLFGNDTRANGTLTLGAPTSGSVAVATGPGSGPGIVVYTPAGGFSGRATFTYTVTNTCGRAATATVTITVNPANRAPVAGNDTATTPRNTPVSIDVLANDSDPDGDALSIFRWLNVVGGTVARSGNQLVFTPTPGNTPAGSFTYEIRDPAGLAATATVSITITQPSNRRPSAVDDAARTVFGTPVDIDVLLNDSDPDGDPLSITAVGTVSPPASGFASIALSGTGAPIVRFQPLFFSGPATFSYTISDGQGGTATATVTVSPAVNRAPTAGDDAASASVGVPTAIDVLVNDSDPDGDPIRVTAVSAVSPPGSAVVSFSNTQATITASAQGVVTFTYTVADNGNLTATATVTVTVGPPPNNNPIANPDDATLTSPATSVTAHVVANDTDQDGDLLTLVAVPAPVPTPDQGVGTVQVVGNDLVFTILPGFTGTATVTIPYSITDGRGGTASSTLTITVTM